MRARYLQCDSSCPQEEGTNIWDESALEQLCLFLLFTKRTELTLADLFEAIRANEWGPLFSLENWVYQEFHPPEGDVRIMLREILRTILLKVSQELCSARGKNCFHISTWQLQICLVIHGREESWEEITSPNPTLYKPCFISPLWLPRDWFWLEPDGFFLLFQAYLHAGNFSVLPPRPLANSLRSQCDAAVTKLWFTGTSENPF